MAYEQSVINAINQTTTDGRVRLAMTVGAGLESTWTSDIVNSIGATGPFQIYLKVHPGVTSAQAKDPLFAAHWILADYQAGVSKVSDATWQNDPKSAAALAAYYAEKPEGMYPAARVDQVWKAAAAHGWISGGTTTGGLGAAVGAAGGTDPTAGAGTDASGGTAQPTVSFNPLSVGDWKKLMLTGLFVLGGIALVGAGAWRSVSPGRRSTR